MTALSTNRLRAAIPTFVGMAGLLLAFPAEVVAQRSGSATLYFKNGGVVEGVVTNIAADSLSVAFAGATTSVTQPYASIERIDWPESDAWREAVASFESGHYRMALEQFAAIALAAPSSLYHPAPGNFRDRALRRRLECLRRLLEPAGMTDTAGRLQWDRLPPGERERPTTVPVWLAVEKADWPAAKAAADEAAASIAIDHRDFAELSLLRGWIASAMGDASVAVVHFGPCYALPSSSAALAERAMRDAAVQFEKLPERREEFRALTRLYASVAGRGKLWQDASPAAIAVFAEEPPAMATTAANTVTAIPAASAITSAGPVVAEARSWKELAAFRFEPSSSSPPGKPEDSSESPKFVTKGGKWGAIEAPADWSGAGQKVARFEPQSDHATVVRSLPALPELNLSPGESLRFSFEFRLEGFDPSVAASPQGDSFLRAGLVAADGKGFCLLLPLAGPGGGKTVGIGHDTTGDADLLGGQGLKTLRRESDARDGAWAPKADTTITAHLVMQWNEDGALSLYGKSGDAETAARAEAVDAIADFSSGSVALRLVRGKSSLLLDNIVVEKSAPGGL